MKRSLLIPVVLLSFASIRCTHEAPDLDQFEAICFEEKILPVFQTGCAVSNCHDSQAAKKGYVFSDYEGIMEAITAGFPDESKAYQSIIAKGGEKAMPPDRPLSENERTLIRIWISQGALNTTCGEPPGQDDEKACFSRDVLPILISSCATTGCHDPVTHEEDLILNSYANLFNNEEDLVVPGNPELSKIYVVLNKAGEDRMPPSPNAPLTEAQKQTIYNWIKEGAKDLACADNCDPTAYTYAAVIGPLIQNNCRGCHSGTSPNGGIRLESYTDVKTVAGNGSLVNVINGTNGKPLMPPSNKLSDCRITQIQNWVTDGSLNN